LNESAGATSEGSASARSSSSFNLLSAAAAAAAASPAYAAAEPASALQRQLLDAAVEDAALEDLFLALENVSSEGGGSGASSMHVETLLRTVRAHAQRQFVARSSHQAIAARLQAEFERRCKEEGISPPATPSARVARSNSATMGGVSFRSAPPPKALAAGGAVAGGGYPKM
jgi:hypothetical protein